MDDGLRNGSLGESIRGYWEIDVCHEGAWEGLTKCQNQEAFEAEYGKLVHEASPGTDIYVLYHAHPDDGLECHCVQYLTDLKPVFSV